MVANLIIILSILALCLWAYYAQHQIDKKHSRPEIKTKWENTHHLKVGSMTYKKGE